jgi:L-methionine (R)-S-oxide reductase
MYNDRFSEVFLSISKHLKSADLPMVDGLIYICTVLRKTFDHYDWVGFYFADLDKKMLHLKAYSGNPVEHQQIPFGKGICGQVAVSNQNFIVPDVNAHDNYLACSIDVKSEIVIPVFLEGQNIGQIDIDSHKINPFCDKDVQLLEAVCDLIAKTYSKTLLQL